jgi:sporulation protein YlmC with PRC-barrel domain
MLRTGLLAGAYVLALASATSAQTAGSAAVTTAGSGSAGVATRIAPDELRASKIIGRNVYGPDDKSIGDIDDLVLGIDGAVRLAVISVGGFLGLGSKQVAVPWTEVKLGKDDHLTVNLDRDKLASAPAFDYAERGRAMRDAASRAGSSGIGASGFGPTAPR